MDSKLLMIGGAAAVALIVGAIAFTGGDEEPAPAPTSAAAPASGQGGDTAPATPAATNASLKAAAAHGLDTPAAKALEEKGYLIGDIAIGSPDAPVTIVEYLSTTCPHCANFHNSTLPALKEKYIETGKVRLIMREVYFNEPGLWSSLLARCSGPESQYHAFMDVLFQQQSQWAAGNGAQIADNLRRIGRLGGLPAERIEQCLNDGELITFLIERYRKESEADGVRSTPHFNIDGETVTGARSFEEFSSIIDRKLGG